MAFKIKYHFSRLKIYILLGFLIGAFSFFALTKITVPDKYMTKMSISIGFQDASDLSSSEKNTLLDVCVTMLGSDAFVSSTLDTLGDFISQENFKKHVTMSADYDNSSINVVVTLADRQLSKDICLVLVNNSGFLFYAINTLNTPTISGYIIEEPVKISANFYRSTLFGGFAGAALVSLAILIVAAKDKTLKSVSQLRKTIKIPVLGEVSTGLDEFSTDDYEKIRVYVLGGKTLNSPLMLSSVGVFEGIKDKDTEVCLRLSETVAKAKKTLLVDTNFKSSALHKKLGVINRAGFEGIVNEYANIDSEIYREVKQNLDFLPSGMSYDGLSELMLSDRLSYTIDTLAQMYGQVILHAPPLADNADYLKLAGNVAGVILVAYLNETTSPEINETLESLKTISANVVGIICCK